VTLLLLGILRPLIARAMAPVLYAFAVLILVDRVRAQLVVTPLGDQVVLLMGAPAWTDRFDRWLAIKSDLNVAVYGALQAADMEIAIPQREVRLRRHDAGVVTIRPKSDTRPAMQKV